VVHVRQLGDITYTFIVSGKLWRNSLIMMDEETESLWSHVTGEALDGAMKGRRLEVLPSIQTTWNRWTLEHPEAKLLKKEEAVRSSRYQSYFDDPDRTGMFRANWLQERLPGKELVHGIVRGPHALAVSDFGLAPGDTLGVELGEDAITVVRGPDGGVRAFLDEGGVELVVRPAFWFAWSSFYPNTLVAD
jgi:hypothetical protein